MSSDPLALYLTKTATNRPSLMGSEEAIRQAVILPILSFLGWDIYDVREVIPEFRIETRRVDYCLHIQGRAAVYIEVKRLDEELERHQRQLLEYAFADGVPVAILTNGLLWWLYLPLTPGFWSDRRFFTIDIMEQQASEGAQHFRKFLARDAIASGDAVVAAEAVQNSKQRQRKIEVTIPQVWQQLFLPPDEDFLELLAEKVERMCGYRPYMEQLAAFVTEQSRRLGPQSPSVQPVVLPQVEPPVAIVKPEGGRQSGIVVRIGAQRFSASSVSDLYQQVLRNLVDSGTINVLEAHIPFSTSNKRYLLARTPRHPNGNAFWLAVSYRGYYMEAHKSYENAVKSLDKLLEKCELEVVVIKNLTG